MTKLAAIIAAVPITKKSHRSTCEFPSWSPEGTPAPFRFNIMSDAQTAKPQPFRNRDGWFPYNLGTNLAQMH